MRTTFVPGVNEGGLLRIKLVIAAAALAASASPSLAAEFYIVQDLSSKRCTTSNRDPPAR
jgi:hypothetical protein